MKTKMIFDLSDPQQKREFYAATNAEALSNVVQEFWIAASVAIKSEQEEDFFMKLINLWDELMSDEGLTLDKFPD